MQFLRNFTIRRVVLWILIAALSLMALATGYGTLAIREINRHADHTNGLAQQLLFLHHATGVMQQGTATEKAALLAGVPSDAAWDTYRSVLSTGAPGYNAAAQERLTSLQQGLASDRAALKAESSQLGRVFLITLFAVAALLIFCDRYLVVHLVRPVSKIRAHFRVIADGDLTQQIEDSGRNCVGQLVPLVREMQRSLLDTVVALRDNAVLLQREAGEIAGGNNDLSGRTATQAAAVEQTAASMEEITATVKHSAENARQASELADVTTRTTQKGEQMVKTVVSAMGGIEEGSEKIRQFTATINGIAFQTNILALNAAVEAARAGEQGRGFAVVASEVRTLAQRSATAAKEIEGLIADTLARIGEGSRAATSAGHSMDEILRGVGSVNELIGQIALASDEQSKGISQVTLAVAELDRVTQQNATLVQQVSTSAGSLSGRTATLGNVISRFTLPAM